MTFGEVDVSRGKPQCAGAGRRGQGRSSARRMSRWSALFIRWVAPMLAIMMWVAPLYASEEVPRFDFSDRPKFSEAEAEAEAIIREAARKLCAGKRGGGESRWGYKAFGAVRESCGPERKPPPPLSSDGRFELWSGCLPMDFLVNVDGDAEEVGPDFGEFEGSGRIAVACSPALHH